VTIVLEDVSLNWRT